MGWKWKACEAPCWFVFPQLRVTTPSWHSSGPSVHANKAQSSPSSMEHATVLSACFYSKTGLQTSLFSGTGAAAPFSSCPCSQQIWSHDLGERSQSKQPELGVYFQSDSCDLVALLPIKDEQFLQQTSLLPLWKSKQGVIFCSTNSSPFEMSWAFKAWLLWKDVRGIKIRQDPSHHCSIQVFLHKLCFSG